MLKYLNKYIEKISYQEKFYNNIMQINEVLVSNLKTIV